MTLGARAVGGLVAGAVLVALAGCGGTQDVVATVGGKSITQVALRHEMRILLGGRAAKATGRAKRMLALRALSALISARWLLEEAKERGLLPSPAEAGHWLKEREATSFPGGDSELRDYLAAAGETVMDLEHEGELRLVAASLRASVIGNVPPVSRADAAWAYARQKRRYLIPRRRLVLITNRKTAEAAEKVKRKAAAGRAGRTLLQRETVALPSGSDGGFRRHVLDWAISQAKPHSLVGPVKERVDYFVFEVIGEARARYRSFLQVENEIVRRMTEARRAAALAAFQDGFRGRWGAVTHCRKGYMVSECLRHRSDSATRSYTVK